MPTTVVQGIVSARTRMHRPIASRPGHNARAIASLTIITFGEFFVSSIVMPRPRRMRVPVV
jgi:hypothetical protein